MEAIEKLNKKIQDANSIVQNSNIRFQIGNLILFISTMIFWHIIEEPYKLIVLGLWLMWFIYLITRYMVPVIRGSRIVSKKSREIKTLMKNIH